MVGAVFGTRWLWVKYGVDIQGVTVVLAIAASGIANYFDTDGKLLEERAPKPIQLAPLQTVSLVVELADTRGGAGANFIVEWVAEAGVRQPVVEAIMVNVSLSNAFAFTSPGRVVEAIAP